MIIDNCVNNTSRGGKKYQTSKSLATTGLSTGCIFSTTQTATLIAVALYHMHLQVKKCTERVRSCDLELSGSEASALRFRLTFSDLWF